MEGKLNISASAPLRPQCNDPARPIYLSNQQINHVNISTTGTASWSQIETPSYMMPSPLKKIRLYYELLEHLLIFSCPDSSIPTLGRH